MLPRLSIRLRSGRAFTLVEVTLALGIVAFALVAILGVMPLALGSGRQSFDEGRAAAVANTLFASFRGQSFTNVRYLDSQYDASGAPSNNGLDLTMQALATAQSTPPHFYATFMSAATDTGISGDTIGSQRRLCFTSGIPATGADYRVDLYFSLPDGVVAVSNQPRQAIQIEMVVTPRPRPQDAAGTPPPSHDQYRFLSTVTNRAN